MFEGASFTLNDVFNVDPASQSEPVTFSCKVDSESISKKVSEMVEDYNKMVDEIAKQVGSRPNRKYQPLTDEAKAKMTELEIKNYEDKAKEGLLSRKPPGYWPGTRYRERSGMSFCPL